MCVVEQAMCFVTLPWGGKREEREEREKRENTTRNRMRKGQ